MTPTIGTLGLALVIAAISVMYARHERTHFAVVLGCLGLFLPCAWVLDASGAAYEEIPTRLAVLAVTIMYVAGTYLILRKTILRRVVR